MVLKSQHIKKMEHFPKKNLKIVMLTTVRLHQSKGGTEKVMIDTANAMVGRGHDVTIIFRDKNGNSPGFSLDKKVKLVNCADVKTSVWNLSFFNEIRSLSLSKRIRNRKKTYLNLRTTACRYRQAIMDNPADVYVTYDPKLSAMLVKEFDIKIPVVTTFQFDPSHIIHRYNFEAIKPFVEKAGPIQVLLPEFKNQIIKELPAAKCVVIPNAVQSFANQAELKKQLILHVGRVMPLKNQELIAKAMILLRKDFPNWIVRIVEEHNVDESYTSQIREVLKKNRLEKVVLFCGPTNHVDEELEKASIFVFPSVSEGFGLALAEAMSAGIPCVALRSCSASKHLINENKNGLLCDNTPESLAQVLAQLMRDRDLRLRLGRQAKEDIQKYRPEKIWEQWENLFYSLTQD